MDCSPKIIEKKIINGFFIYEFMGRTFSVVEASTWTPALFRSSRTTFSLPEYEAKCNGVIPDSFPNAGTSDAPFGGSDLTAPGT